MKETKLLAQNTGNIGDILIGSYDQDLAMNLVEFLTPFTLLKSCRTHRFLVNLAYDENFWERGVKRDISDFPKLRRIYDYKLQAYRPESYRELYVRVAEVILQIRNFQERLNFHNPLEIKISTTDQLLKLFYQVVDHGFDKFDNHFPGLFSSINMNTALKPQDRRNTLLHISAARGHIHLLKYILSCGANVNVLDAGLVQGGPSMMMIYGWLPNYGETPLISAAEAGETECLSALIEAGSNVNFQNPSSGMTALHRAAIGGHVECIQKLLSVNALTEKTNKEGHRALDIAKNQNCHQLLTEKMRQRGESTVSSSCLMM